jgi:hypothetical protein
MIRITKVTFHPPYHEVRLGSPRAPRHRVKTVIPPTGDANHAAPKTKKDAAEMNENREPVTGVDRVVPCGYTVDSRKVWRW